MLQASALSDKNQGGATGKTLLVHIGDHKTGSTSIQAAFALGQVKFPDHKVIYPARMAHNYLQRHVRSFLKGNVLKGRKPNAPGLGELSQKVRDTDADFILLSAEAFEGMPPRMIQKTIQHFFADHVDEIRVIAYVRPHAARTLSSFAEQSKLGMISGDLEAYAAQTKKGGRFVYQPRFKSWRDAFGEQFTLRPMIRGALRNGSVVDDFICHSFGEIPYSLGEISSENESLGVEDLVLLRLLQSMVAKRHESTKSVLGWELARMMGQHARTTSPHKLKLHRSLAEDLRGFYLQDAQAMDAEFFDGKPLLETELNNSVATACDHPQSFDVAEYYSPDEIRSMRVLMSTVNGMMNNETGKWGEFFHRRRELAGKRAK